MSRVTLPKCQKCMKTNGTFTMYGGKCERCWEQERAAWREERRRRRRIEATNKRTQAWAAGPNGRETVKQMLAAGEYIERNPQLVERMKGSNFLGRLSKYRLSETQWLAFVAGQGSACAICKKQMDPFKLHIDHCHETGVVRGLLCGLCNTGLGQLGIDGRNAKERANAVVAYLKKIR